MLDKNSDSMVGAALVSNTMICEVARLFETASAEAGSRHWRGRATAGLRVLDLFSLIDALVLNEKLYTLPSRREGAVTGFEFRQKLIEAGIAEELDTRPMQSALGGTLLSWLEHVPDPVRVAGSSNDIGRPIVFETIRDDIAEFLLVLDPESQARRDAERLERSEGHKVRPYQPPLLDDVDDFFGEGGGSSAPLYATSFAKFGRSLIGWIEYAGSGAYEHCTSILRDAYYILAAEHVGLPYWPEVTRTEFARQFPNYYSNSDRLTLYAALSEALKTSVADVFDDHATQTAFIPPFAALALARASSKENLITRIFELRNEFAKLRANLVETERERRGTRSIRKRLKLRARQRLLLNEVGQVFEKPTTLSLEGLIRYVPDVMQASSAPTDPTKYKADLLLKPAALLARWWIKRPISLLFDVSEQLKDVPDYPNLVARVFGSDVAGDVNWPGSRSDF